MIKSLKSFLTDDAGGVTVDWVVLAALLIGLCLAVMATVGDGAEDLTADLNAQLSSQMISTTF